MTEYDEFMQETHPALGLGWKLLKMAAIAVIAIVGLIGVVVLADAQ